MLDHHNVDPSLYSTKTGKTFLSNKIPFYIYTRSAIVLSIKVMSYNECGVQHMLGNASSSGIPTKQLLIIIHSQYMIQCVYM